MKTLDVFVACGDGSADLRHVSRSEYFRELYEIAVPPEGIGYLIQTGQVTATGIKVTRHETFDTLHWLTTGEHKPAGAIYITEITHEAKS